MERAVFLAQPVANATVPGGGCLASVPGEASRTTTSRFIREADLPIADGQYTESEYPAKIGWGHPRVTTIVDAAMLASVEQLAIYRHDPMQTDADVDAETSACQVRLARFGAGVAISGAREGLEIRIG